VALSLAGTSVTFLSGFAAPAAETSEEASFALLGLALGLLALGPLALGLVFGLALGPLALGLVFGLALGLVLGLFAALAEAFLDTFLRPVTPLGLGFRLGITLQLGVYASGGAEFCGSFECVIGVVAVAALLNTCSH